MSQKIDAIHGKLEPRKIYPVTEDELKILKRGSGGSLYLNFAIAILSISISAFFIILTVENLPVRIQAFIDVFTVIGFIVGTLLLMIWKRMDKGSGEIFNRIEARIKEEKAKEEMKLKESPKLQIGLKLPQ